MIQYEEYLAAVEQNGLALRHVQDQTPEICLAAIERNGSALQYINEQTSELCLIAVKQNKYALKFVKDQTSELFDLMLDNGITIMEKYIKIPVESLSSKIQLYLKLK